MYETYEPITRIIIKSWNNEATPEELEQLSMWSNASRENREFLEHFRDGEWVTQEYRDYKQLDIETPRQKMWDKINQYEATKTRWRNISIIATAAVLLLGFFGLYEGWFSQSPSKTQAPTVVQSTPARDLKPGTDTATLTLADGSVYQLHNNINGLIASTTTLTFYKEGGKLRCQQIPGINRGSSTTYFSLKVPRGGQFQIELADGSKAWINAASSIQIPDAYTDTNRMVSMTGQVYFEVQSNKLHPFIVRANGGEISATGTRFVVNAYKDENNTKAALLEGEIKVSFGEATSIVRPRHTATILANNKIVVKPEKDIDKYVGWTKGNFVFENDSLTTVVRQLARWYDMEVNFIDTPAMLLSYTFSRNRHLDTIVYNLQTGDPKINIKIDQKTLVIRR
jgi:transmembrane sensor